MVTYACWSFGKTYNANIAATATAARDMTDMEAMLRAPLLQVLVEVESIWRTSLLPAKVATTNQHAIFVVIASLSE